MTMRLLTIQFPKTKDRDDDLPGGVGEISNSLATASAGRDSEGLPGSSPVGESPDSPVCQDSLLENELWKNKKQ